MNIIGTKKYLVASVFNKKTGQVENKVIKADSSTYKAVEKAQRHIEQSIRHKNRLDK